MLDTNTSPMLQETSLAHMETSSSSRPPRRHRSVTPFETEDRPEATEQDVTRQPNAPRPISFNFRPQNAAEGSSANAAESASIPANNIPSDAEIRATPDIIATSDSGSTTSNENTPSDVNNTAHIVVPSSNAVKSEPEDAPPMMETESAVIQGMNFDFSREDQVASSDDEMESANGGTEMPVDNTLIAAGSNAEDMQLDVGQTIIKEIRAQSERIDRVEAALLQMNNKMEQFMAEIRQRYGSS